MRTLIHIVLLLSFLIFGAYSASADSDKLKLYVTCPKLEIKSVDDFMLCMFSSSDNSFEDIADSILTLTYTAKANEKILFRTPTNSTDQLVKIIKCSCKIKIEMTYKHLIKSNLQYGKSLELLIKSIKYEPLAELENAERDSNSYKIKSIVLQPLKIPKEFWSDSKFKLSPYSSEKRIGVVIKAAAIDTAQKDIPFIIEPPDTIKDSDNESYEALAHYISVRSCSKGIIDTVFLCKSKNPIPVSLGSNRYSIFKKDARKSLPNLVPFSFIEKYKIDKPDDFFMYAVDPADLDKMGYQNIPVDVGYRLNHNSFVRTFGFHSAGFAYTIGLYMQDRKSYYACNPKHLWKFWLPSAPGLLRGIFALFPDDIIDPHAKWLDYYDCIFGYIEMIVFGLDWIGPKGFDGYRTLHELEILEPPVFTEPAASGRAYFPVNMTIHF